MSAPRSVADIEAEANEITDESLEATRRMRALANDTRDVGAATLEELNEQGEQLRRVEQNMDQIERDVKQSERHLHNMDKCCGLCVLFPCCKSESFDRNENYREAGFGKPAAVAGEGLVEGQPGAMSARGGGNPGGGGVGGGNGQMIKHVMNDAREDEMDANLGAVSSILGDLKNMSAALGDEIDNQDETIDAINRKGAAMDNAVNTVNKHAENVIRNI